MKALPLFRRFLLVVFLISASIFVPQAQRVIAAGVWYVSPTGSDSNNCSAIATPCKTVNGAISKAAASDTIYITEGVFTGTGDQVVLLDESLILSGGWNSAFDIQNGVSTIDGQNERRGITVNSGVSAAIERFVIQNGYAVCNNCAANGGGIENGGTLTLSSSSLSQNSAPDYGGGINNTGSLLINSTTFRGNRGAGSGIANWGALTLNNSAVVGNFSNPAAEGYAGIFNQWGAALNLNSTTISGNMGRGLSIQSGTINLNNVTITGNEGGIRNYNGDLTLQNTIVAGNTQYALFDCEGALNSLGYNILGEECNPTPGPGDQLDTDPVLGALIGLPGKPPYNILLPGSPAIDAGNPTGCTGSDGLLTFDQRGAPRQGRCDIGAYEATTPGAAAFVLTQGGSPQSAPPGQFFRKLLLASILDSLGTPIPGQSVTFSAPSSGASGVFLASSTSTATLPTGDDGIASADFQANNTSGSYTVNASAVGVAAPAQFALTNSGWYVAPGGNDSNPCTSPAAPCATLQGVVDHGNFVPGGTILAAEGVYTGSGIQVLLLTIDAYLSGGWDNTFDHPGGMSVIDGQNARRGLTVETGVTAVLERFILQNGSGEYPGGGGITTRGSLTLNQCLVQNNSAYQGAGIRNSGWLVVNDSTLDHNITENAGMVDGYGGALYHFGPSAVLNNVTISRNTASYGSGGIRNEGGTVTLSSVTSSENIGGISGGGTTRLKNSLLSNAGYDCENTTLLSGGYNLIAHDHCAFAPATGDQVNVNPKLGTFEGQPGFYPLLRRSPAVNAGNPSGCADHNGALLTQDQRGKPRAGVCDIGAYEAQPLLFSEKKVNPDSAEREETVEYSIVLINEISAVGQAAITDKLPEGISYITGSLHATTGSYAYGDGSITWTGAVTTTEIVTITFGATVNANAGYGITVVNSALISSTHEIFARSAAFDVPPMRVFLPACLQKDCPGPLYADDFSNPSSGWPVSDDGNVGYGYLAGEYRILVRDKYWAAAARPGFQASNFSVSVDIRNENVTYGSYGLAFGISQDWSSFYSLEIYQNGYYGIYRYDPGGVVTLAEGYSPAIKLGFETNNIEIMRNEANINAYANGQLLASAIDSSYLGARYLGLVVMSYDEPNVDIRFDNFVVTTPGCAGAGFSLSGGNITFTQPKDLYLLSKTWRHNYLAK